MENKKVKEKNYLNNRIWGEKLNQVPCPEKQILVKEPMTGNIVTGLKQSSF